MLTRFSKVVSFWIFLLFRLGVRVGVGFWFVFHFPKMMSGQFEGQFAGWKIVLKIVKTVQVISLYSVRRCAQYDRKA